MQVYEAVKAHIEEHRLSPAGVARAAGISAPTFQAILAGKRKLYAEELKAICIALGVRADTFIHADTEPQ